jgi:hypothetical protein
LRRQQAMADNDYGYDISAVTTLAGSYLPHTIVGTLMRIDLPEPLAPGATTEFAIEWAFNIVEEDAVNARSGYEHFPDDPRKGGNDIYLLAQWFPRLVAYSDYEGWHNKEFLGRGEFTLEFGDYEVAMTVPGDHIVASTGVLQNPEAVLTATQRQRLEAAKNADAPMFIVTPQEAAVAESGNPKGTKTWRFNAANVRDFAWASSRKFMWDAQGVKQPGAAHETVLAMSFWPKEGGELWRKYSTTAVVHTLKVYSRFSFDYPYPTAQSVNGPVGGMEYPMITFNGPRPVRGDDGSLTYTERAKNGLIGVVIHEVGHIYFPMVVNSDERQWTWMDEGLNSFLQFQAEKLWDADFPARGEPSSIIEYMVSQDQVPIMTQSDSLLQFGNNAYAKPATALVILRETVLGRDLFDRAFREYAQRWAFKRPTPYDFFRTMEESSGVDLDWFWRGWFYSTDHVDISLESVTAATLESADPEVRNRAARERFEQEPISRTVENNRGIETVVERDPATRDFYNATDRFTTTAQQRRDAESAARRADADRRAAQGFDDNIYRFTFRNVGGLVMPVILKLTWSDGSDETIRIPAEIWRRNSQQVIWQHVSSKTLVSAEVDPLRETADANRPNNLFPRQIDERTLRLAPPPPPGENRMRDSDVEVSPDSTATRVRPPAAAR